MTSRILTLLLLFGFWLPPGVLGWWAAGRAPAKGGRAVLTRFGLPVLVLAWVVAWFFLNAAFMPPYVSRGPHDPQDAPAMLAMAFAYSAVLIVLPGSALACWLAYRKRRRMLTRSPQPWSTAS
jgi:hypothetical protein